MSRAQDDVTVAQLDGQDPADHEEGLVVVLARETARLTARRATLVPVAEPAADDPDAEPGIRVEITPRDYRRQARLFLVAGLLMLVVSVWLDVRHDRSGDPVLGVVAVGYGLYCRVQARRQVTRTVLEIGRTGIRSGDGRWDETWSGVVLVWVGSSSGLRLPFVAQPVLSVFTRAGVEFAARAGTRPKARYSVPVGPPWTVGRLCAELRGITGAAVVDGRAVSRSSAAGALAEPGGG